MIPLEKQVCSLELAKRLKELGVKQESYFSWVEGAIWDATMQSDYETPNIEKRSKWIAAFTVAELGEMLPDQISSWKMGLEWICSYDELHESGVAIPEQRVFEGTEADARAKMLIYLVENKFVTL